MKRASAPRLLEFMLSLAITAGCATQQQPKDYSQFLAHKPRSILVLPPLNQSTQVEAPYIYLSTITQPLAECGYYVFPVAIVDAFMKENGLPSADEMQTVPLNKIREILGADAVLYVTIEEWGQKYVIIDSITTVKAKARLVDVATGTELWTGQEYLAQGTGNGNNNGLAQLVVAAVSQVVGHLSDRTHEVSRLANNAMVFDSANGLLRGNYRPVSADTAANANDICTR
jgi:hypothetical protein